MNSHSKNDYVNLLANSLLASEKIESVFNNDKSEGTEFKRFHSSDFFKKWFTEEGCAYYFLFRKNLKITNIQFAELLALIRSHNKSKETGKAVSDLQFLSPPEFYTAIREIVESFPHEETNPKSKYELIADLYYSLLSRHVVVDSFFGSCAVFVPPSLEIDLPLICANSGYIHSCGKNIFTRKIDKTKKEDFFQAIERHLTVREQKNQNNSVLFTVYAHEDFTENEKPEKQEYLRHGLDDVKVYIEKFYMDAIRLVDVVEEMREEFKDKIIIPPSGTPPSHTRRKILNNEKINEKNGDPYSTIWLLVDYSISKDLKQRGDDRFYICYEQMYINESPFQFFDENKPAWLSHTTMPHSLLSAMLNITGLSRQHENEFVLADPFGGTGTTWLEAIKLKNVITKCTDIEPIAPLMAEDNLDFFCKPVEDIEWLITKLDELEDYVQTLKPYSAMADIVKFYRTAIGIFDSLNTKPGENYIEKLSEDVVTELRKKSFNERFLFYIVLRTVGRSSVAIQRGTEEWGTAFAAQANRIKLQLKAFLESKKNTQNKLGEVENFSIYQSLYSKGCVVSEEVLKKTKDIINRMHNGNQEDIETLSSKINAVKIFDVRDDCNSVNSSLVPNSCDVIVTDPPYGFNTDSNPEHLARLYSGVIEKMINALKEDGQLVICLLDRSHTGRRSPYFTHKEIITQQILSLAERSKPKREVIIPAYAVPERKELFRAPFYWESERALRRAILHFRLKTINEKD
ncbi:MAG TPA: hypothetical protein VF571_15980 [Pyrinomonadaceae bacterium]|jgi:tRNA G10  N-methylase Trm11